MLAVVGEAAYRADVPGFASRFIRIALPVRARPEELAREASKLKWRAVALWPAPPPSGLALARLHAEVLAACGVAAVHIVAPPADWPATFQLGDPLPPSIAPPDLVALVSNTLRDAAALALPIHNASHVKETRALVPTVAQVDGAALLARLRTFLSAHLSEPPAAIDAIALWCLHAWIYESFDVSPRLVFHARDARAAHARALRVVAWLTPAPLVVSRTIAAHLLPVIAADRPTLLLDDVGGTMLSYIDMRALIAAGALKDGAFVSARTKRHPSGWSPCFAPTALATAARLPDDVRARAIVVPMSPPPRDVRHAALPLADPPAEVPGLRADMQRWAKDAAHARAPAAEIMPAAGDPAACENWYPLLALAHALGPEAHGAAKAAMLTLADASLPHSADLELLSDIRELAGALNADSRVPSLELLTKLVSDRERAWATAYRGGKLTARVMAERLAHFGVKPVVMRYGAGTVRGYRGDGLIDAFARYLPRTDMLQAASDA